MDIQARLPAPPSPVFQIPGGAFIVTSWRRNRPLTLCAILMVATLILAAIGLLTDPRVLTGQPLWLKPAKFGISGAIYAFTVAWLLTKIEGYARIKRTLTWVTTISLIVEVAIIVGQAFRFRTSHFNFETPLDSALYMIMAVMIMLLWLAALAVAILLLRQRFDQLAFAWSLRLGILIAVLGMALAFSMTVPTAAQLNALHAGGALTHIGGHTVDAPDDGPGLPIVGWSTTGGDLRIAHFFGLHGLQLLPLLGLLLTRRSSRLRPATPLRLIGIAGVSYSLLVLALWWQAERGEPLLRPGALIAGVLAVLALMTIGAAGWVLRIDRTAG